MPEEYAGDATLSALRFRQGWFYTGDLGRMTADDLLRIEGRVDDQLNLSGVKLDPTQIEQVILACAGVHSAAVIALPQHGSEPLLAAAIVGDAALDLDALQRHCVDKLDALAPQRYVVLDALPLTPTGKVMRNALAALLAPATC